MKVFFPLAVVCLVASILVNYVHCAHVMRQGVDGAEDIKQIIVLHLDEFMAKYNAMNGSTVLKRGTSIQGIDNVITYTLFATCEYVTLWVIDLSQKFEDGWMNVKYYKDSEPIPNTWLTVPKNPALSFLGSTVFTIALGPYHPCTTVHIHSQLENPQSAKAVGIFSAETECPCQCGCGQGDPHYTRFDQDHIEYSGPCSYILVQTCKDPSSNFKVVAKHGKVVNSGARRIESAEITARENTIILTDKEIILNGMKVDGDDLTPDARVGIEVINNSSHTIFSVSGDWWVEWSKGPKNHSNRLVVGIHKDSALVGKLCGLLGNKLPNGQPEESKGYQMANGDYTYDVKELGDSWVVPESCDK